VPLHFEEHEEAYEDTRQEHEETYQEPCEEVRVESHEEVSDADASYQELMAYAFSDASRRDLAGIMATAASAAATKVASKLVSGRRVVENDLTVTLLDELENQLDNQKLTLNTHTVVTQFATHKLQQDEENKAGGDFFGVMRIIVDNDSVLQKVVMVQAKLDRGDGSNSRAKVKDGEVSFPAVVIDAVKKQHADMQTLVSEPYVLVISRDGCFTLNASVVAELDAGTEVATRPISEWFADIALCPVGEEASQELIDRIQSVAKLKQLSSFVLTAVIVDDDL